MRVVIVITLTIIGWFTGIVVGALVEAIPPGLGGVVGPIAGFAGGMLLARQTPTRRRHDERTERYQRR